ncbi:MAG: phytanoyl-CoA dioxygenase family protein [Bacteroidota bacterium]
MELSKEQLNAYDQDGFLVVEQLLSDQEIQQLKTGIRQFDILKELPNVICEEDGVIRSIFAPDKHNQHFDLLFRDARFLQPGMDLIEAELYLYQYKLNLKRAFAGRPWEWHQDFPYWQLDDGVKIPDMISVMIYLDDTRSFQGPLMVIPGSHKFDVVEFERKAILDRKDGSEKDLKHALGANLKYTINKKMIREMADRNGIQVLEYKAGATIFFHPNLFHASNSNMSPYERDTIIITYNSIHNAPLSSERPEFVCSSDHRPIQPVLNVIG